MTITTQHPEIIPLTSSVSLSLSSSLFNARIQYDSATQISLRPYGGSYIAVAGELIDISSGLTCTTTTNLISSTGADAGAATSINTLYYVYTSNSNASYAPLSLRLSTTAYSTVNGVRLLGSSTNALNWRFVGWVRTISNAGTPNFADSLTQRLVINYYNRRELKMFTCPGYVNDNNPTAYTVAAGAGYVSVHGGTDDFFDYIDCAEGAVLVHVCGAMTLTNTATDGGILAFGVDSTTQSTEHDDQIYDGAGLGLQYYHPQVTHPIVLSEGYHRINMIAYNFSPTNTILFYADGGRSPGETEDVPCTYMSAIIKG